MNLKFKYQHFILFYTCTKIKLCFMLKCYFLTRGGKKRKQKEKKKQLLMLVDRGKHH